MKKMISNTQLSFAWKRYYIGVLSVSQFRTKVINTVD